MKMLVVALLITFGCGTVGHVDWPTLATCSPSVPDLVSTVTRILLGSGDVDSQLEQLAAQNGPSMISCVVDQLVQDWTSPGTAAEPARLAAAERGRAFLEARHVTVSR